MPTLCVASEGRPRARGATLERRGSPSRRWSIGTRVVLSFLAFAATPAPAGEMSCIVAAEGKGYLEQVGDQLVLHVAGTPYEMGWQHGRLLRKPVQRLAHAVTGSPVDLRKHMAPGRPLRRLAPQALVEEAAGLADGAGIARELAEYFQLFASSRIFLSGSFSASAWGAATAGGALYHAKRITYPDFLACGLRVPDCLVLVVTRPASGEPCAYATFPGVLGAVAGMNAHGVSITAQLSAVVDRWDRAALTTTAVREALQGAQTRNEALRLLRRGLRGRGFCCMVSDRRGAVVVEGTRSRQEIIRPSHDAENAPPHLAIPDVLRRTSHFVHPDTAADQRRVFHSGFSFRASQRTYWSVSQRLIRHRRGLDARQMARTVRDAGDAWGIVCCPAAGALWVVLPKLISPGRPVVPPRLHRLPLRSLLADQRVPVNVEDLPEQPHFAGGTCECADTLEHLSDPDPKVNELLQLYNFPAEPFPWRMQRGQETEKYNILHVTFPSAQRFDMLECNTIHAEYYLPKPVPKGEPALIVLHILDGRFLVARMVCRNLAAMGIPCLMVQMPYYGDRRPRDRGLADIMLEKPERMFDAMQATVPDIRRAACWLQDRPEVDPDRIGLLGVSLGAVAGAIVAGVDQRFNRNVLVIGGGDPATIVWNAPETRGVRARLTEMGYTRESLAQAIRAVDPITFAHRVNPKQILMINATHDKTIPKPCTIALWEAMGKPAIRWHAGGHYTMGLYTPVVLSSAYNFIRNLPADTSWR